MPPSHIAAIEVARLLGFVRREAPEIFPQLPPVRLTGSSERELWDERVADRVFFDLWAAVARAARRPSLPVDFGAQTRFEHLGLFGLAIRTAGTVAEAFERTRRFQTLFTNSGKIHLEADGDALWWRWSRPGARSLGLRLANEAALVEQVALVRELLPGATPRRVRLRHPAPVDVAAHRRFFGCTLEWSAVDEGICWPASVFERQMPAVEPALSRYFSDEATRKLAALDGETVSSRTREVLARRLVSGDLCLEAVAAELALTPRRLRTGLAAEDTNLRTLLDEVRRDTARVLVDTGRHSMTEIAFLLGLSETSAFSRAWRRWFGEAPRASRGSSRASTGSSRRAR